jgi:hypothetical protein
MTTCVNMVQVEFNEINNNIIIYENKKCVILKSKY